jgi:hypothetical protein
VATYRDRWIACTEVEIRIRFYYFPVGTKRIKYEVIKGVTRVHTSAAHGRGRIWGTGNPHYWASLDPQRPRKRVAFVLDVGRFVRPFLTPDDPDAFEAAVRSHTDLPPSSEVRPPVL